MEFTTVLENRTSIRDFSDKPVDRKTLTAIISDAQKAPSWANSQPWKVYIATSDTLKALREDHMRASSEGVKGYPDLPNKSLKDWGALSYKNITEWLEEIGEEPFMEDFSRMNARLWHAPAIAYITIPRSAPAWSVFDTGSFAHLLMLAAASRGVDTMVAYENIKYPGEARTHLNIPEDEIVVSGIALGYRSDDKVNSYRSPRSAVEEILTIK